MKKWIHANTQHVDQIYGGIYLENGQVKFNWNSDDRDRDVISLVQDVSGTYVDDNVEYVYGYVYNEGVDSRDCKVVRDYFKNLPGSDHIYSEDVDEFAENAILELDAYHRLKDFQAVITTKPSKDFTIIDVMNQFFHQYLRNDYISFELLKNSYRDVRFDVEAASQAMRDAGYTEDKIDREIQFTLKKFNALKKSGELFQMKRFIPKEIREGFRNFLKFKTEEEQQVYETLQGVDVLIYDDFLTSGATVKEIVRYLRSFNNQNKLTVFVLVKQH